MIDPLTIANRILTAVTDGFADTGQSAAVDLPTVQYVAEGRLPAADGEQLTVAFVGLVPGMPGRPDRTATKPPKWTGQYEVELLRSRKAGVRTGGTRQSVLPTATEANAAGVVFATDLLKMLEALTTAVVTNAVTSHWQKVALGGIETIGPDGDLIGVLGKIDVLLL